MVRGGVLKKKMNFCNSFFKKEHNFLKSLASIDIEKKSSSNFLLGRATVLANKVAVDSKFKDANFNTFNLINNNLKFSFIIGAYSLKADEVNKFISYKSTVDLSLRAVDFLQYQRSNYFLHYIRNFY